MIASFYARLVGGAEVHIEIWPIEKGLLRRTLLRFVNRGSRYAGPLPKTYSPPPVLANVPVLL